MMKVTTPTAFLVLAWKALGVAGSSGRGIVPDLCREHPRVSFPEDYDPAEDPVDAGAVEAPMQVMNLVQILEVVKVDDKARAVTLSMGGRNSWWDPRVKADEVNGTLYLKEDFFRACLWSPSLNYIYLDELEDWQWSKESRTFYITEDKQVAYNFYSKASVSCVMEFSDYPFDRQYCDVVEMMFSMSSKDAGITSYFFHDEKTQRNLQYSMEIVPSPRTFADYFSFKFPLAGFRILLQRKLYSHIMQTYLPTSLFVVASWISFLIPPDVVPGRMTLLVTLLLVQVSIFLRAADDTPTASGLSALTSWIISCITIVMAAVIQYGVVLFKCQQINGLGTAYRNPKHKTSTWFETQESKQKARKGQNSHLSREYKILQIKKMDRISFVAFPTVSASLAVAYWAYFLNKYYRD